MFITLKLFPHITACRESRVDTTSLHHALLTTDLLLTAAGSFWSQLPLNNDCSSKCLTLIMKSQDTDSVRGNREKHD